MNSAESRFKMTKKHHSETFKKAKKDGKMDLEFIPLCTYIEKTKNFFTASCCAGRITLVGLNKKETKKESAFHRKWHRKVKFSEVRDGIESYSGEVLWFKQEPIIFHLGTNNLENAKKVLVACEKAGVKRSGIKVAKEGKFIIEIVGTHQINTPVREHEVTKLDDNYLKYLVKKANQKFDKNKKSLKKMEKEMKKILK
jgi:tRNA(Phe) wybutosine-synthesizing methylase Tyw3